MCNIAVQIFCLVYIIHSQTYILIISYFLKPLDKTVVHVYNIIMNISKAEFCSEIHTGGTLYENE